MSSILYSCKSSAIKMEPKRFTRSDQESLFHPNVKPLHSIFIKSAKKIIGTYTKKPSARKPQLHDRSFRPSDINYYVERCRRRNVEPPLDHHFDEFFDEAGGTSSHRRPLVQLPKRRTLLSSTSDLFSRSDELPSRPRIFGRSLAKVAPYQTPQSSTKYKTGEDGVPVVGPWVIKTRSYLRKRRQNQQKRSQSASAELDEPVSGGQEVEERRDRYNRVEELIAKKDELHPVPPKLQKLRIRHKTELQSLSKAPEIGRNEDGEAEDGQRSREEEGGGSKEKEEEEGGNEKEEEGKEEEEMRAEAPDSGDASEINGRKDAADEAEVAEAEEEGDDDTDGRFLEFVQGIWDNSDRASVGMKLTRKCFGFSTTSPTQKVIGRPFFTVWITIIQAIIYFIMIGSYGIAPIHVDWKEQEAEVLMKDLSIQHVSYRERSNLWIGPREADLIHLGAKFAPCIRSDKNVAALLEKDRKAESTTGCCVNNDGSGCVQSTKSECSNYISTWNQSTVCGEDPKYCRDPELSGSYAWPKDIAKWPVCKNSSKPSSGSKDYHMMCEVVGRPCCVGVQGECVMATREYCNFRRGYFHENASLCSQVSCLNEVCGMIPFTDPEKPDQFYRFFTSLCIHPGLLALVITQIFQWIIQFDLERYIGTLAMAFIYVGSGYCGSILSAIFIPYFVEAGPSGSQFGVLAAMTVEIVRWNAEEKPHAQLVIIFLCLFILFIIGIIVPQVDNWAHLAGYVVGLLLSVGFRPYKHFCYCDVPNYCVIITQVLCFVWAASVAAILTVVFYLIDVKQCDGCQYFNCVPFTDTYCIGMGVNITSLKN